MGPVGATDTLGALAHWQDFQIGPPDAHKKGWGPAVDQSEPA